MRQSREEAARTHARIVEKAAMLFRERGIDGIGLADLMHEAGLTHGGFYKHFESKDRLAAEACAPIGTVASGTAAAPVSSVVQCAASVLDSLGYLQGNIPPTDY